MDPSVGARELPRLQTSPVEAQALILEPLNWTRPQGLASTGLHTKMEPCAVDCQGTQQSQALALVHYGSAHSGKTRVDPSTPCIVPSDGCLALGFGSKPSTVSRVSMTQPVSCHQAY